MYPTAMASAIVLAKGVDHWRVGGLDEGHRNVRETFDFCTGCLAKRDKPRPALLGPNFMALLESVLQAARTLA